MRSDAGGCLLVSGLETSWPLIILLLFFDHFQAQCDVNCCGQLSCGPLHCVNCSHRGCDPDCQGLTSGFSCLPEGKRRDCWLWGYQSWADLVQALRVQRPSTATQKVGCIVWIRWLLRLDTSIRWHCTFHLFSSFPIGALTFGSFQMTSEGCFACRWITAPRLEKINRWFGTINRLFFDCQYHKSNYAVLMKPLKIMEILSSWHLCSFDATRDTEVQCKERCFRTRHINLHLFQLDIMRFWAKSLVPCKKSRKAYKVQALLSSSQIDAIVQDADVLNLPPNSLLKRGKWQHTILHWSYTMQQADGWQFQGAKFSNLGQCLKPRGEPDRLAMTKMSD